MAPNAKTVTSRLSLLAAAEVLSPLSRAKPDTSQKPKQKRTIDVLQSRPTSEAASWTRTPRISGGRTSPRPTVRTRHAGSAGTTKKVERVARRASGVVSAAMSGCRSGRSIVSVIWVPAPRTVKDLVLIESCIPPWQL